MWDKIQHIRIFPKKPIGAYVNFQIKKRLSVVIGILLPLAALITVIVWRNVLGESRETASDTAVHRATSETASNSIGLTPRVIKMSGIEIARATEPTRRRKLELRGSLAFDSNRLVNVSAQISGTDYGDCDR